MHLSVNYNGSNGHPHNWKQTLEPILQRDDDYQNKKLTYTVNTPVTESFPDSNGMVDE